MSQGRLSDDITTTTSTLQQHLMMMMHFVLQLIFGPPHMTTHRERVDFQSIELTMNEVIEIIFQLATLCTASLTPKFL